MVEKSVAYASHRWSKTNEKKSPTYRECLAVLWAVDKFASYLQARPFTLITDCSALTWLFKSQALSAKYHRWALRLMQYDMELQWRPGTKPNSPTRYRAPMATKPVEPPSTTPSRVTTRRKEPTDDSKAQCLTAYIWVNWIYKVLITTIRYPSRYLPQSSSLPTCRPRTPTQSDTDLVPTHWVPHRCSQKL